MNLKEELVWAGNEMIRRGLTVYTTGNISVRTEDGSAFYIKPSNVPYPDIRPEDIVTVDLAGNVVSGTRPPSKEHDLHRLIYVARPDVAAIVHAHSQYATTLATSKLRQGIPPVLAEVRAFLGGSVDLAEYAPAGSWDLAQNVVKALGQEKRGILLKNHGALAAGKDLRQALDFAEVIEMGAQSFILAQLLGGYDEHPETYRSGGT